ncbi:Ltp family lipoprotein, partial [Propionibacterium freudenreichii]|uniref:Ltp family lipoprotein n=1 Tax=Propionibacterium freudenreichii TaxID=1744 RepID=UPI0025510204
TRRGLSDGQRRNSHHRKTPTLTPTPTRQPDSTPRYTPDREEPVYDQLVSEYGEQFSAPAAQYAIDNVKADWNANALAAAKSYQSTLNMSPAAIHDQLTSSYGGKFTQAEADYALAHLND